MTLRYEVLPGTGLVARYADSILWVGEQTEPAAWEALGAALRLEPGIELDGTDTAGALDSIQQALEQYPQTVFAALIVAEDRAQGLLRGPVTVRNQNEAAPATGHGQLGITVPFTMSQAVYVGVNQPVQNPETIRSLLDLDGGVVPGGGAWVHPLPTGRRHASSSTGVNPQVEPQDLDAAGASAGAVSADAVSAAAAGAAGWPTPEFETAHQQSPTGYAPLRADGDVAAPHSGEQPAHPQTAEQPVQPHAAGQPLPAVSSTGSWASPADAGAPGPHDGTHSPEQRAVFQPAPDYARVDLRAMEPQGRPEPLPIAEMTTGQDAQQPGPRTFGAIVFEDGSTFALDRDYVVGRRPEKDPRVQSGQAAALTVADPDTVLSSAHALVAIRGGQIALTDLGSLNGTHVAPPGAQDWTRLQQHQEVQIVPGTRLLFGWTVATYSGAD